VSLRLKELTRSLQVVAYCRGPYCLLSYEAVAELRKHGYDALRLEDGYPECRAAGLRIETETKRRANLYDGNG